MEMIMNPTKVESFPQKNIEVLLLRSLTAHPWKMVEDEPIGTVSWLPKTGDLLAWVHCNSCHLQDRWK